MLLILRAILLSSCFIGYNFNPVQSDDDGKPTFRYDYNYHPEAQGWFKLHLVPETWFEARKRCKMEGAELVAPSTNSIVKVMTHMQNSTLKIFTGLHSIFSYGDYYSISGLPMERMPVTWLPLGPESDIEKRCVVLFNTAHIINVRCNETYPYICYKRNDNVSLNGCGTTDNGYFYVGDFDACYKYHNMKKTWRDSYMSCSAEGGHLVIINSTNELGFIEEIINYQYKDQEKANKMNEMIEVYIGVVDMGSNEWSTIHGDDIDGQGVLKWAGGEPPEDNNFVCGGLSDGLLKAISCDNKRRFICKKKPDSLTRIDENKSMFF